MSRLLSHGGADFRASRLPSTLGPNAPTFPGPRYSPAHPACTTSASMHCFMPKFMTTARRRPATVQVHGRGLCRAHTLHTHSQASTRIPLQSTSRLRQGLPTPSDEMTTSSRKRAYSQVYQLTTAYTIWHFVPNLDF